MNEIEVIKSIANHLSDRKKSAALNNYKVLGNVIRQANESLDSAIAMAERIYETHEILLAKNANVVDDA